MKQLNRTNVQANKYPERIIQFGEGNFLRAFVDWIIYNMNQKAEFNSSVVIVQPLENGMVNMLNEQDGLYHVNLQGLQNGKEVDSIQLIDVVSRGLNPYAQYDEFLKLAENPEMRFVISNTTEAGIAFDPSCKLEDTPAKSYPGKLTQLLFHRFKVFNGAMDKGLIIFPCELINISSYGISGRILNIGSIPPAAFTVRLWIVLFRVIRAIQSVKFSTGSGWMISWLLKVRFFIYGLSKHRKR